MKIALISDTHGYIDGVVKALKKVEGIESIIHLGDYVEDSVKIGEILDLPVTVVRGNCDAFSDKYKSYPKEDILEINNFKIFLTHGDNYGIKMGIERLYYRAKELGANAVFFGHSHIPMSTRYDDILFLNPGSPSMPRGGAPKTFSIVEIDKKISVKYVEVK